MFWWWRQIFFTKKMLQLANSTLSQANEKLSISISILSEFQKAHTENAGQVVLLSKQVERNEANVKIHQPTENYSPFSIQPDGLKYKTTAFQILDGMLNSLDATHYSNFQDTIDVVVTDILKSNDLQKLSEDYDKYFLMPMRSKSGPKQTSRPVSPTQRVLVEMQQPNASENSSTKNNAIKSKICTR